MSYNYNEQRADKHVNKLNYQDLNSNSIMVLIEYNLCMKVALYNWGEPERAPH